MDNGGSAFRQRLTQWNIDAINQVRAEKACDGDALAQAAAQKLADEAGEKQKYGFCWYSTPGHDDQRTYMTQIFAYDSHAIAYSGKVTLQFNEFLASRYSVQSMAGICTVEHNLANAESSLSQIKSLDFQGGQFGFGNVMVDWLPSQKAISLEPEVAADKPSISTATPSPTSNNIPAAATLKAVQANTGRGWLGVYVGEIQPILAKELGVEVGSGAYIEGVAKGGAAEQFQLQSFDVIQSVDNQPISGHNQFIAVISPKQAGSAVDLTIWRARKTINQRVILSPNPPSTTNAPGAAYCVVTSPGAGPEITWISYPFPVQATDRGALAKLGTSLGNKFVSFLQLSGISMNSLVGSRKGYAICNFGLASAEGYFKQLEANATSPAFKSAGGEVVKVKWVP